ADFLIQILNGADPHGAISILEDKDITINADGSYEVFLCAEKKTGMQNWMELPSGSPLLTLMVRNEHAQWDKEQQGPMQIERVGTSGIANPGTVKDAFIKRINYTREILARQGTFWPKFAWKITTLTKKNSLTKFKTTGDIGIQTQKFSLGYWELEDDEALIVKLTEIDAGYCGFHMANFWGSSPDWQNKFSSMSWGRNGRSQAYKSKDGFYYIVVTKNDPGIQNWIETSGMKKGLLVLRLQGLENPELSYKPETQVVKHSQLRESLPADMPAVTLEQRSELLKMRQQNVLKRYTYW
ncbi:MAG: hypothetical protein KAH21_03390, partial [Spirochaetaceae bacterium]|nr:hypothetical protein [Spirochaetaceae bacterium]